MHWLFCSHVGRHRKRYTTTGRLWQGRFKAFAIQQDHHFLTVLRYVERNALAAKLVQRAEEWQWNSLRWREMPNSPLAIDRSPVRLPSYWTDYVNQPQTAAELAELRTCVQRDRPFGEVDWVVKTAHELGVESSISLRGRPKKTRPNRPVPFSR
jgi:putative transposase